MGAWCTFTHIGTTFTIAPLHYHHGGSLDDDNGAMVNVAPFTAYGGSLDDDNGAMVNVAPFRTEARQIRSDESYSAPDGRVQPAEIPPRRRQSVNPNDGPSSSRICVRNGAVSEQGHRWVRIERLFVEISGPDRWHPFLRPSRPWDLLDAFFSQSCFLSQKWRTSSSRPVISQRIKEIGIMPAARNWSWKSFKLNRSRSCIARSARS